MTNCLFYAMFFCLFLNLSFGTLRYSQINRVFLSIYKGMLEASVVTIDGDGEPVFPYYDRRLIKDYVEDYLEENVSKYTKDYDVKFYLWEKERDNLCHLQCSKIRIILTAKVNHFIDYKKEQVFVLRSSDEL